MLYCEAIFVYNITLFTEGLQHVSKVKHSSHICLNEEPVDHRIRLMLKMILIEIGKGCGRVGGVNWELEKKRGIEE